MFRYYQKQLLEDQLKERRERLHENRMKEEKERLTALGYTGGEDSEINMVTLPETGAVDSPAKLACEGYI